MLEANDLPITDENIFIAASCSEKGIRYLKGEGTIGVRKTDRKQKPEPTGTPAAAPKSDAVTVTLNGKNYAVKISGNSASVNGRQYDFTLADGIVEEQPVRLAAMGTSGDKFTEVHSTLPGAVVRILVKPGESVQAGQLLMVLEAMKMETPINAPGAGVLAKLEVAEGEQVQSGALLAVIRG